MNGLILIVASLFMAAPPPTPAITFSQQELSAVTGQVLALESVVASDGRGGPMIAHLNVTSLDGVYVDLEDWARDVTQPVPAGEEVQLDWEVQAVNTGRFAIYAVLLPADGGPLIVSPPVHVTVAAKRSLDTGGAMPVAIGMPVLLAFACLAGRFKRSA